MSNFKILNVWSYSREGFDMLAKKYGMQSALLFDHMVKYFLDQNISPLEKGEVVHRKLDQMEKNIVKQIKGIIGFLRIQENEIILPMVSDSNKLLEKVKGLVELEGRANRQSDDRLNEVKGDFNSFSEGKLEEHYKEKLGLLKKKLEELVGCMKVSYGLRGSKIELKDFGIGDMNGLKEFCKKIQI